MGSGSDLVNLKDLDIMPGSKPSIPSLKEDNYYGERSKSGPELTSQGTPSTPVQLSISHVARHPADLSEVRTFIRLVCFERRN